MSTPHPWKKPKNSRSALSGVTDEQLCALYNRQITTRALAALLGTTESWLSTLFPGKVESERAAKIHKRELIATRREYRRTLALKVLNGSLSFADALILARVCDRTMYRAMKEITDGSR